MQMVIDMAKNNKAIRTNGKRTSILGEKSVRKFVERILGVATLA